MGNLIWKEDGWYISGADKIKVGDKLEVRDSLGEWRTIVVAKDAFEVFHPEPFGTPFDTGIFVRKI